MSIFSDHKVGALSDFEFNQECRRMNREDQEYFDQIDREYAKDQYCKNCEEHNENCPYYDAGEECWDYDQCYKDTDGWGG